jgi:DNA-binding LytR/AlgR family response regulator
MTLVSEPLSDRAGLPLAAWIAGALLLCLIYASIFVATEALSPTTALLIGVGNVAPLVVLAAGLRLVIPPLFGRSSLAQTLWHLCLAVAFSLVWYPAARVGAALVGIVFGGQFHVTGFTGPALAWQLFQGLVLYAALAALIYAERPQRYAAEMPLAKAPPQSLDRYLIRDGEDFRPVQVNEIVTITGAQDYSEVATPKGRHLVRLSLSEFESRLDPARFIRVHRSKIIHLAHLERAELAGGGRMLAHMSNGEAVSVSRTGVKALRSLIV